MVEKLRARVRGKEALSIVGRWQYREMKATARRLFHASTSNGSSYHSFYLLSCLSSIYPPFFWKLMPSYFLNFFFILLEYLLA